MKLKIKTALEHVRGKFPYVTTVLFTAGQVWFYMSDDGTIPNFEGQDIDVNILEDALDAAYEDAGLPSVYRLDVPVGF